MENYLWILLDSFIATEANLFRKSWTKTRVQQLHFKNVNKKKTSLSCFVWAAWCCGHLTARGFESRPGAFHCEVCMSSPCMRGSSPGTSLHPPTMQPISKRSTLPYSFKTNNMTLLSTNWSNQQRKQPLASSDNVLWIWELNVVTLPSSTYSSLKRSAQQGLWELRETPIYKLGEKVKKQRRRARASALT